MPTAHLVDADETFRSRVPVPERPFLTAVEAVNSALGGASNHHGGRPCPERTPRWPDGRPVLAYCDRGCFDDAADVLAPLLDRLRRRPAASATDSATDSATACATDSAADQAAGVYSYTLRVARTILGDLHRQRRKELGLPQRPERVTGAGWAVRRLPAPADRELLAHMLTWLGSDAPATGDAGWPVEVWAARYHRSPAAMSVWIDRVVDAIRTGDPDRYRRYLAGPLAAKPRSFARLAELAAFDHLPLAA